MDLTKVCVGQWADYLDTGVWTIKDGTLIPPSDLTDEQFKDFMLIFGQFIKTEA